ncbi:MAG: bifunctional glutamate N-acetyltransferase/amino-acid acetyltransferase ArgJ [Deltaproteobacteria bacterium]|nr:bifunctional glutamate N-acetyltransferase/amino-acid acetyltransferase ArgJ [Deltaproteobacteria bacterium]
MLRRGDGVKPAGRIRISGFRGAGAACGIKKSAKPDLALVVSGLPCVSDVVFTRNRVFAAPVAWGKALRGHAALRGVIVNSGNANACTGEEGLSAVRTTSAAACAALGLPPGSLLVSSTGVIGVPLPAGKIVAALPGLCASLSADGIARAGDAILTTDAWPKRGVRRVAVRGGRVTLGGIAKGAGMIAPNMGTMLAYVFTDASVRPADLRRAFRGAVDLSFNRIVVDGDTSTNDTAAIFANGACGLSPLAGKDLAAFSEALRSLLLDLALLIVRDGEGATRVVRMEVTGAANGRDAERAARAVATSPLVKTAVFGADLNWGRVVAAVGRAGIRIDPERVELTFAGEKVLLRGMEIDRAALRRAAPKIRKEAYGIEMDLGLGKGSHHVYFSDLNHDYVRINAGYRT